MERDMLFELAKSLGFGTMGICAADGFEQQKKTVEAQPPLLERRQLRFDPSEDYPWAKSLLVLLWPYHQATLVEDSDAVFVDSYYEASNAAYHAARMLEESLNGSGVCAKANVSYPAREAAVRAGLGIIGHSGMLITPQYGTRVVIILVATDMAAPEKKNKGKLAPCLNCGKCAKACPTGAIGEMGMANPERCLRNFMMEGIVVPEENRKKMGMKLLGCDICQRVCPMQPCMDESNAQRFTLNALLTLDDQAFAVETRRLGEVIGKNAARPQRIRAQAALLAGNRKRMEDLPVLRQWAESDFEAVREHARWAIGQMETN